MKSKNGVGMGGAIIEELGDRHGGSGRAIGLSGGERAEGDEHGGIHRARIVKERADHFLEVPKRRSIQRRGGVVRFGILDGRAIGGRYPGVRRVLKACGGDMKKRCERSFDVPGHGYIDGAKVVIPLEGETAVQRTGPVDSDRVERLKCVNEVIGGGLGTILYAEVVDDEAESEREGGMGEKPRGVGCRDVSVGGKVTLKAFVRQDSRLRQPVHAFPNFDHDVIVVDEWE